MAIRQERLESVRMFIGDLCVVFSAEDANVLSQALNDVKKNYEGRYKVALKVYKSVLYTTMLKLIEGPISAIINQLPEAEQKQFKIEENKIKLQKRVTSLDEALNQIWGVAMVMKNFGHPVPKINSHDATEIGLQFVRRPPRAGPFLAARSGYHHDFTA